MLLVTERHTPKDLDFWGELELADLAHYRVGRVEAKAARSLDLMRAFAREGPCYASVSWGKDSTVLAHLVYRMGLAAPPVGNVAQHGGRYDPYVPAVRDRFLAGFPLRYREEAVPLSEVFDDGGHTPALDVGIRRLREAFGTPRYLGGVRADESGARRIGMMSRGLVTISSCQPLGWWTAADVFAYLAYHGLPVHPAYAMLGGGRWDRQHIRVSILGGPKGNQFGRAEWEREYYGDVLRRLAVGDRYPSGGCGR